jgi:hypothetical protein
MLALELRRNLDCAVIGGDVMDLLLAALGMLACIAIMAAVMPLGMRVARRVRDATAKHGHDSSTSARGSPPSPIDHRDAGDPKRDAGGRNGA